MLKTNDKEKLKKKLSLNEKQETGEPDKGEKKIREERK